MKILIINAGSSSLKYQLIDMANENVLAKGLCERIGIDGRVKHSSPNGDYLQEVAMPDHAAAIRAVLGLLTGEGTGVIADMGEIAAVGHRVVHGGEAFNKSVLITDKVIHAMEECIPLAPLHNPPNLTGISACRDVMGDVPQVGVFDTAFHQTMPEKAFIYALPYTYYEKYKIRRYGFHGTSHSYVANEAARIVGKDIKDLRIITCHMGNGSSITAVDGGRSVDTSMGFTPLEGVPMGTRSGCIDPAILDFLAQKEGLTAAEENDMLNKKSGVLGISGVSSDFRDLYAAADKGCKQSKLALDHFAYCVKRYIGGYAAIMGGCDVLVFTAGIGENTVPMREEIAKGLEFMGLKLDPAKNAVRGTVDVSATDSAGKILVIPTNEELVIARDTKAIVSAL